VCRPLFRRSWIPVLSFGNPVEIAVGINLVFAGLEIAPIRLKPLCERLPLRRRGAFVVQFELQDLAGLPVRSRGSVDTDERTGAVFGDGKPFRMPPNDGKPLTCGVGRGKVRKIAPRLRLTVQAKSPLLGLSSELPGHWEDLLRRWDHRVTSHEFETDAAGGGRTS
jgi:hypothetical protein